MAKKPIKKDKPQAKRKQREASDPQSNSKQFFTRVLHRAYLRDGNLVHTGEALTLALLLHAQGKKRTRKDIEEVARLMDDPNLRKS